MHTHLHAYVSRQMLDLYSLPLSDGPHRVLPVVKANNVTPCEREESETERGCVYVCILSDLAYIYVRSPTSGLPGWRRNVPESRIESLDAVRLTRACVCMCVCVYVCVRARVVCVRARVRSHGAAHERAACTSAGPVLSPVRASICWKELLASLGPRASMSGGRPRINASSLVSTSWLALCSSKHPQLPAPAISVAQSSSAGARAGVAVLL